MTNPKNALLATAEYLWLDGGRPVQGLRSKARILTTQSVVKLGDLPLLPGRPMALIRIVF